MYGAYIDYVKQVVAKKDLSNFKRVKPYRKVLEHVNDTQGLSYYQLLTNDNNPITTQQILNFSAQNDSFGNPNTMSIANMSVSPTTLRYLYHARLILDHLNSNKVFYKTGINIVEVGGGYGGLCLAINYLNISKYRLPIKSYTIIDLEDVSKLQELYLSKFKLLFPVSFRSDIGNYVNYNFLISNYAISEFDPQTRMNYMNGLANYMPHGFMVWNGGVYNFSSIGKFKRAKHEPEKPQTGKSNVFVYF